MNLIHPLARLELRLQRRSLIECAVLTLAAIALSPWSQHATFAVLGVAMAGALGTQLGGAPSVAANWEFTLTRSLTRRQWLIGQYAAGALPLALAIGCAALGAWGHWRERAMLLLAPPLEGTQPAEFLPAAWVAIGVGSWFVYSHAFAFAVSQTRGSAIQFARTAATLLSLLILGLAVLGVCKALGRGPPTWNDPWAVILAAPVLVAMVSVYVGWRVERLQLLAGDRSAVRAIWHIRLILLTLVAVLLLFIYYYSMPRR